MKEATVSRTSLREERARLLLTQQDLATRSGLTAKTIRGAESGDPIAISTARALLRVLNEVREEYGMSPLLPGDLDWNIAT